MRFSQILGNQFHNIYLKSDVTHLIDLHFTAASHHFWRYQQSQYDPESTRFHFLLFSEHLKNLMQVIYRHGDFSKATDPTGLELNRRERWNPDLYILGPPDPEMFDSMPVEAQYGFKQPHPNDMLLPDLIKSLTEGHSDFVIKGITRH